MPMLDPQLRGRCFSCCILLTPYLQRETQAPASALLWYSSKCFQVFFFFFFLLLLDYCKSRNMPQKTSRGEDLFRLLLLVLSSQQRPVVQQQHLPSMLPVLQNALLPVQTGIQKGIRLKSTNLWDSNKGYWYISGFSVKKLFLPSYI